MEATSIMNHPAHTRSRFGDWVLLAELHMENTSHQVWHYNPTKAAKEPTTHPYQEAKHVWIVVANQAGEDYVVHPGGYVQRLVENIAQVETKWDEDVQRYTHHERGYGNSMVNHLMEAVVEHSAH